MATKIVCDCCGSEIVTRVIRGEGGDADRHPPPGEPGDGIRRTLALTMGGCVLALDLDVDCYRRIREFLRQFPHMAQNEATWWPPMSPGESLPPAGEAS